MCGGTTHSRLDGRRVGGLSPRVRGNPTPQKRRRGRERSIPACAGEPNGVKSAATRRWVYPRVCGGTDRVSGADRSGRGLSPRVRGNRKYPVTCQHKEGSIPACAGEPGRRRRSRRRRAVYPRVCGGTIAYAYLILAFAGLSPRVRGNPERTRTTSAPPWSIPACAGEPRSSRNWRRRPAVYPRVCGGTGVAGNHNGVRVGLSPRVRGNPDPVRGVPASDRSIPACAGEPGNDGNVQQLYEVYPRVCGGTAAYAGKES